MSINTPWNFILLLAKKCIRPKAFAGMMCGGEWALLLMFPGRYFLLCPPKEGRRRRKLAPFSLYRTQTVQRTDGSAVSTFSCLESITYMTSANLSDFWTPLSAFCSWYTIYSSCNLSCFVCFFGTPALYPHPPQTSYVCSLIVCTTRLMFLLRSESKLLPLLSLSLPVSMPFFRPSQSPFSSGNVRPWPAAPFQIWKWCEYRILRHWFIW